MKHEIQSNLAILWNLERQWAVANQNFFIVSMVLNLFFGKKQLCFATNINAWKKHGLFKTIKQMYCWLLDKNALAETLEKFNDYKHLTKCFFDNALLIQNYLNFAKSKKKSLNLLHI